MNSATRFGEEQDAVPTAFVAPPKELLLIHSLHLSIPLPTAFLARTLYQVISVDKPLRPKETHIAFRINDLASSVEKNEGDDITSAGSSLEILLHTSTVRQMRLSANAILDDINLVLETMQAFPRDAGKTGNFDAAEVITAKEGEFELNGTGRAG